MGYFWPRKVCQVSSKSCLRLNMSNDKKPDLITSVSKEFSDYLLEFNKQLISILDNFTQCKEGGVLC